MQVKSRTKSEIFIFAPVLVQWHFVSTSNATLDRFLLLARLVKIGIELLEVKAELRLATCFSGGVSALAQAVPPAQQTESCAACGQSGPPAHEVCLQWNRSCGCGNR